MTDKNQLDSFNRQTRDKALRQLIESTELPPAGSLYNMHCHSFFSYNSKGWSPSHIAFNCAEKGLYAAALCDFDVLDGLEEFLSATQALSLRSAVHLETRAYIPELSDVDISSPGEPGVTYIMGCGFTDIPEPESHAGKILARLRQGAQERNLALIARINKVLPEIAIDYEKDVMPLTPQGVATERHIVRAYRTRSAEVFKDKKEFSAFWAPLIKCSEQDFEAVSSVIPEFEDMIRAALAKRGGIGYSQPTPGTFPAAKDFAAWVRECHAIPAVAWLDGTSGGEADAEKLLDLMTGMGCAAVNIIPDRNWNIKDAETAALKQKKLDEFITAAVRRDMPVNIGTEMNKGGLPFVDDISGPVLKNYADVFTKGTNIMVGQSVLAKYADMPYCGEKATAMFETTADKNAFYAAVGALPALTEAEASEYAAEGPEKTLALIKKKIAL
ncbi:MAG: hypothetical protein R6V06_01310 [Kiritimatiellia bacterium]